MNTPVPPASDPARPALPVVAIVGRPNVGKSALFNRLIRRRLAIVHEQSGVTRDRVVHRAEWEGRAFQLVDTGGLSAMDASASRDAMEQAIQVQAEAALAEADVVILVGDVTAGLAPLDRDVAGRLRAAGRPVLVAVNKCDHPGLDAEAQEFARLGHGVYPVSALHNRGIDELLDEVVRRLPPSGPADPAAAERSALRITVTGRPNVGKSSLINRILRQDRVIVSAVPGTTRDSVDIPFSVGTGPTARHYVFTDTAGMRRVGKIDTVVERFSLMRAEKSIAGADVVVHVFDATSGPTDQDKKIADRIAEHGKGCLVVVNKWDLAEDTGVTQRAYEAGLRKAVPFLAHVPVVFASTRSGFNIRRVTDAIDRVAAHLRTRLPTGQLNRTLGEAIERTPPPMIAGRRFKLYYATQVGVAPLRIVLFVNEPVRLPTSYRQYLVHTLRARFPLEGVPVEIVCRERPRSRETE